MRRADLIVEGQQQPKPPPMPPLTLFGERVPEGEVLELAVDPDAFMRGFADTEVMGLRP